MNLHEQWPALPYEPFKSTAHLIHMGAQMIGKLKLHTSFEPHWTNVMLLLTSRGFTTGPIPYQPGTFNIDIDLIDHQILVTTSEAHIRHFAMAPMSVAQFYKNLFSMLHDLHINLSINLLPQEIPSPIPFDQDNTLCDYDKTLATAWWHIILNSSQVMQRYHARFNGYTPPIGLMWGSLDLRDARYNGVAVPATGINADYIRRNAMNEAHIETGWWHGNDSYPHPAYYAYTYPQPNDIAQAKILPNMAHWENNLSEFILDYDVLRHSNNPEQDLLNFFESTYRAGAQYAHWDKSLINSGHPC